MLNQKILQALNDQIKYEFEASNLYLQMSTWLDNKNYEGFSSYLFKQSCEERNHGLKILEYILDHSDKVNIKQIDEQKQIWDSLEELFGDILTQEERVTSLINNLYTISQSIGDYATSVFLQWFIIEQIEEEKTALTNLDKIKIIGSDIGALLEFDEELGDNSKQYNVSLSI